MAEGSATKSVEQVDKVTLRVMVDKERTKVLYAEAGKDFVDVLLSFLTLPLGTIARLVAKDSNIEAVKFGCLSSLYQSVSDLDEQYLWNPITCKEMLLKPRNSMEPYFQKIKLNIDDTEPIQYFLCENWICRRNKSGCLLSTLRNKKCSCGKVMSSVVSPERLSLGNGFVKEIATFIISDDLSVMHNVLGTVVNLHQRLGINTIGTIVEQTVDITKKEVVDILKLSLLSKTPLTDFILNKKQFLSISNPKKFGIRNNIPVDDGRHMSVKVMIRKSTREILFAEAEEDFVDLILSFLTFPLGGVLHMLQRCSSLNCIDNLYKSMVELSPERYLISKDLKEKLIKPRCAPHFELSSQILPIGPTSVPTYYCHTYYDNKSGKLATDLTTKVVYSNYNSILREMFILCKLIDPKSSIANSSFARGPSMYMVTDDLCVTPLSSISTMSYLSRSKVPLSDLEERVIKIGVKEGLNILNASLMSVSALTNGLNQFTSTIKVEK